MLVVVAILGFATALAAPSLRDASGERALRHTASEVATLLREARAEALLSGSDSVVSVDLDAKVVSASWKDRQVILPPGVSAAVLTAREELVATGQPAFRFYADGSATGGAFRLALQEAQWLVSVDWLTGRIERSRAPT